MRQQQSDRWPWALAFGFAFGVLVTLALVWFGNMQGPLEDALQMLKQVPR